MNSRLTFYNDVKIVIIIILYKLFLLIITLFRSRGYCENLMDDLVLRMEQYANNLEALVEEKTDQLSQEKRRSEELLFQVLPRLVLI